MLVRVVYYHMSAFGCAWNTSSGQSSFAPTYGGASVASTDSATRKANGIARAAVTLDISAVKGYKRQQGRCLVGVTSIQLVSNRTVGFGRDNAYQPKRRPQ